MGLLDKLWDDTVGGPMPEKGVGKLRKLDLPSPRSSLDYGDSASGCDSPRDSPREESALQRRLSAELRSDEARRISQSISIARRAGIDRSASLPSSFVGSPGSPGMVSPATRKEDNVWRSVFHPGSNKAMERVHSGNSGRWDTADPKAPSVYDWYPGST